LHYKVGTEVTSVSTSPTGDLNINGDCLARTVVNAAGVFGDIVEKLRPLGPLVVVESRPRLGQFVVFEASSVDTMPIVYHVPNERLEQLKKGIVLLFT
jgi:L-2-hydroxyglutarate oxidase LhgO